MKRNNIEKFTEETILRLFGNEAGENEDQDRLKEYYFKNDVYSRITAEVPLKILVGHKGIGKSALFNMSILEDIGRGILPILIKPDDIIELGRNGNNLLEIIRDWKSGLKRRGLTSKA
jgi:hypothetical protein